MKKAAQLYALDELDNLVHIKDADDSHVYRCLVCKKEMITKNKLVPEKRKRISHFAHEKDECPYDNYLHTLAKIQICKWLNQEKSILLSLEHRLECSEYEKCSIPKDYSCSQMVNFLDLKKYFKTFELEKRQIIGDKDFVPDIFSFYKTDKGNIVPLFIEIYVTHKCDETKINSGVRIIELTIKSEMDIDNIINQSKIIPKEGKVKLYNFKPKKERTDELSFPMVKYVLNPITELMEVKECSCKNIEERKGILEVSFKKNELNRIKGREKLILNYFKAKAFEDIFFLRDCSICKRNASGKHFFCLESKYWDVPNHNAKNCDDFQTDNMKYKELIDFINSLQNSLQVWKDPNWK